MYCGDETGSFIGDVGSYSARFGYGGNNVPSYVVPSMVMTHQQQESDTTSHNETKQKKIFKSSIPTSCYNFKYGHPLDDSNINESVVYDYRAPMRRVRCGDDSNVGPVTDPTSFLQQGDSIEDWDAYEHLWMNAMDTLSVRNTLKHTTGRVTETTSINTNEGDIQSTTIRSTSHKGDNRCTHPILVVSPGITHSMMRSNSTSQSALHQSKKEMLQLTELMMEKLDATAMFIAPTPMLSSFAHGRQTSLMVDIGASGTRVTPVVDGLLLKQSQRRSGRGTDWIQNCIWQALQQEQQQQQRRRHRSKSMYQLTPRYRIKHHEQNQRSHSNTGSTTDTPPPPPTHGIFHRWAMNDLLYEIRTSEHVALPHWWYDPSVPFIYDDDDVVTMDDDDNDDDDEDINIATHSNGPHYELPDGTRIQLSTPIGKDICRVPELFFSGQCPFTAPTNTSTRTSSLLLNQHVTLSNAPLHQLIHESLGSVADVDLRRELASSIVLTGGGSASLPNLAARLSLELPRITSAAYKTKVLASGYGTSLANNSSNTGTNNSVLKSNPSTSIERVCAAWIGGSILTSLGSFQQLWLSKAEYEEYGGTLAIQRFP